MPVLNKTATSKFQTRYDSSFAVKGPRLWNTLPANLTTPDTLVTFKAQLTRYLLTLPDKPPIHGLSAANSLLDILQPQV